MVKLTVLDDTGWPVADVCFGIYSTTNKFGATPTLRGTVTTDANGVAYSEPFSFTAKLLTHYVQQYSHKPGYIFSTTKFNFMPGGGNIVNVGAVLALDNTYWAPPMPTPTPGAQRGNALLQINLKNAAGTPLAGAVYGVYESQYPHWQYLIDYVTTDSNGVATLDTNESIYSVQQVTAPAGYPLDTTIYYPNPPTGTIVLNLTQPSSSATPTPTPTPPPGGDILPTVIWEYTYSGGDWKDQLASITEYTVDQITGCLEPNPVVTSFYYNTDGSPMDYGAKELTWEGKRLSGILDGNTATNFTYDESGIRTSKTSGGVTTNYYYNGALLIGMAQGNDILRFSYDAGGSVISVNLNGTDYYYLRNGQGDVVALIDASGTKIVEYEYDTWGKPTSTTGSLAATLGTLNPFRYRGYIYDQETQLYYCRSRYYDPTVSRFLSADALLSTGQGVLGYNMYAYCLNNPVLGVDNSGTRPTNTMVAMTDGGGSGKSKRDSSGVVLVDTTTPPPTRPPRPPKVPPTASPTPTPVPSSWDIAESLIRDADVSDSVRNFLYAALDEARRTEGDGYVYKDWNCSQFVNRVLNKFLKKKISGGTDNERTYMKANNWTHSTNMTNMQIGDLLYWNNINGSGINHVGIYIGEYNGESWMIDNSGNNGHTAAWPVSGINQAPIEWYRPKLP